MSTFDERRKDLISHGFREHAPLKGHPLQKWDMLFQKKVTDENGIRYFAEVFYWDHRPHGGHEGWEFEVNYGNGTVISRHVMAIKIYGLRDDWTAAEVLEWAEQLWCRLAPNYYERNQ